MTKKNNLNKKPKKKIDKADSETKNIQKLITRKIFIIFAVVLTLFLSLAGWFFYQSNINKKEVDRLVEKNYSLYTDQLESSKTVLEGREAVKEENLNKVKEVYKQAVLEIESSDVDRITNLNKMIKKDFESKINLIDQLSSDIDSRKCLEVTVSDFDAENFNDELKLQKVRLGNGINEHFKGIPLGFYVTTNPQEAVKKLKELATSTTKKIDKIDSCFEDNPNIMGQIYMDDLRKVVDNMSSDLPVLEKFISSKNKGRIEDLGFVITDDILLGGTKNNNFFGYDVWVASETFEIKGLESIKMKEYENIRLIHTVDSRIKNEYIEIKEEYGVE